ncbi:acetylglutamate kinase [Enterococcus sp. DIV2402]|jgi:acetylglutamate kinase|uniref:Acetylglutamate kinase n=1 Tax=Candidatus Enterococcus lowellii TaxID=2230877 RepID=A0ABZ2SUK0_9ENTE|nr:acetylglutamate kinase [Enterococcus sp. DIV2402]MBO0463458.1 acetylglutamate kinase [Enterococcus sp. DIV2402]
MKTIVVKMGGVASDNLNDAFFQKISSWQNQGYRVIIVHGGGHYISKMMDILGIKVEVKQGLRVTSEKTLEITRMVLLGQVQPMITTHFQQAGFPTLGMNAGCDQLIQGKIIDEEKLGFVGEVTAVNSELLNTLIEKHHIPIIAPLGITESGQWLNINADEVACKVAASIKAEKLYLLTDVPGIKKESEWLKEISVAEISQLKTEKVVTGGMLPKLDSAHKALLAGVKSVFISNTIDSFGTEIKVAVG